MNNVTSLFQTGQLVFLDTSPFIYYVEKNPRYLAIVDQIFDTVDDGILKAVTSPITLAECLVGTYKYRTSSVATIFRQTILKGNNMQFVPTSDVIADKAAELRALYNLALPDAIQVATSIVTKCDYFITNDVMLQRIKEIKVLVLDSLSPTSQESAQG